jgi:hypothetical protein
MLYTVGKVLKISFQRYITCPHNFNISVVKPTKQNLQSFSDCRSGWSEEPRLLVIGKNNMNEQGTHSITLKLNRKQSTTLEKNVMK